MRYERFQEPIEVIAHFTVAGIKPLRFLWRGVAHPIERVQGRWMTWDGQRECRHFAISAGGVGNCEIALYAESMIWKIESVAVES